MRTPHNERVSPAIPAPRLAQSSDASGSDRRCILTGETAPRGGLIRLAISPLKDDGTCDVLPDPLARAPGRGAWLGVTRAQLAEAMAGGPMKGQSTVKPGVQPGVQPGVKPAAKSAVTSGGGQLRGALARAFKGLRLNVPGDLPDLIDGALRRNLLDRLGLELRCGKLILGSDRIAEKARMGRVSLLLHARDASEGGCKKLDQAWRVGRDAEGSGLRGMRLPLDRAALTVALGKDNVVHLGLADDAAAQRVMNLLARVQHFSAPGDGGTGSDGADGGAEADGESGTGGASGAVGNDEAQGANDAVESESRE